MASNFTRAQLLLRLPVSTNKEYDNFVMNKKWFKKWYEVHSKKTNMEMEVSTRMSQPIINNAS